MKLTVGQFVKDSEKRSRVADLLQEVETLSRDLNLIVSICIEENPQPGVEQKGSTTIPTASNPPSGPQLAFEILKAAGKPMTKVDILQAIHERGIKMPIESLTSYLSRGKDRFVNVSHGVWDIKREAKTLNATDS